MDKHFDTWNNIKKDLHENKVRVFFHEREIWFASIVINIGFEEDGKGSKFLRPVIIIKKFTNDLFLGISTTRTRKNGKYYFEFSYKQGVITYAILSQIKIMDSKRLKYKTGIVEESVFIEIKRRIITLLQ